MRFAVLALVAAAAAVRESTELAAGRSADIVDVIPLDLMAQDEDDDIPDRKGKETSSGDDDDDADDDSKEHAPAKKKGGAPAPTPAKAYADDDEANGDDDDDTTKKARIAKAKARKAKKAARKAAKAHVKVLAASHQVGTNLCDLGQYYHKVDFSNKCSDCPTGYFQTDRNAKGCLICPKGYYQFLDGQGNCEKNKCKAGFRMGWEKCEACPKNYYSPAGVLFCHRCPNGQLSKKKAKHCFVPPTPSPTKPTVLPTRAPTPLPWKPPHVCKHLACEMGASGMHTKIVGKDNSVNEIHQCQYSHEMKKCFCMCQDKIDRDTDHLKNKEYKWESPTGDDDAEKLEAQMMHDPDAKLALQSMYYNPYKNVQIIQADKYGTPLTKQGKKEDAGVDDDIEFNH